jgi:hypothetical protein
MDAKAPNTVKDVTSNGIITSSDGTDVSTLINNDSNDIVNFSSQNVNLYWRRKNELSDSNNLVINMLMLTSTIDNQKFNVIKILGSDNDKE